MERHMHYRTLEVQPISGTLGAEIHGVDLAKELSHEQFAELRNAYYDYGGHLLSRSKPDTGAALGFCSPLG